MRNLTTNETMEISGGASKYVYCPVCGQRVKVSLFSRIFSGNRYLQGRLAGQHGLLKNVGRNIRHKTI